MGLDLALCIRNPLQHPEKTNELTKEISNVSEKYSTRKFSPQVNLSLGRNFQKSAVLSTNSKMQVFLSESYNFLNFLVSFKDKNLLGLTRKV